MTLKRLLNAIRIDTLFPVVRVTSTVASMLALMLTVLSAGVAAAGSHDHHDEHEHHESHDHDKHLTIKERSSGTTTWSTSRCAYSWCSHLNVAVEGNVVTVYLQTPADIILSMSLKTRKRTKVAAAHQN